MPDLYDRHRKEACQGCRDGVQLDESCNRHWNPYDFCDDFELYRAEREKAPLCTAPSLEQFAESQAQQVVRLKELLELARPYVDRAYECAFPDTEENYRVLGMIDAELKPAKPGRI